MIDRMKPPAIVSQSAPPAENVNPFASVITADVVKGILTKQVEKAQAGDTNSAKLILKIAAAALGIDSSSRRNTETPVAKKPSVSLVAATLAKSGPLTAHQLAARLSCDPGELRDLLENSDRFAFNGRGLWLVAPVHAIEEA